MMKTDDEITKELREATDDLLWMSESDYPFEVVVWEGVTTITEKLLRERAGAPEEAPVETKSMEEFFRVAAGDQVWHSAQEQATARRYRRLVEVIEKHLAEVRVYRIGEINLVVLIVGRSRRGTLLGLQTRVVET